MWETWAHSVLLVWRGSAEEITRLTVTNTEGGKMEISEGFQISSDELTCACVLAT